MQSQRKSRGAYRDRHGRGIRRPLWSPRFEPGVARQGNFADTVQDTAAYLRSNFPDEFAKLTVVVRDLPPLHSETKKLRRYAFNAESNTVYIYRIPIKYLGRAFDPVEEIMRIDSYVIEAAAEMIGRDPRDFLNPEDRD
ncbi:MAG: hypothetical protein KGL72_03790 [Actinomycetales bacterium]|nr:hypothetical protein [Actinomycetales bacterium]